MHRPEQKITLCPMHACLILRQWQLFAIVVLLWASCLTVRSNSTIEGLKEVTSTVPAGLYVRTLVREPITVTYLNTNVVTFATTEFEASWASNLFAYRATWQIAGQPPHLLTVVRQGRTNLISRRILHKGRLANEEAIHWVGDITPPFSLSNPVIVTSRKALDLFRASVNYGLGEVEVGELFWTGNTLTAKGYSVSYPLQFRGDLTESKETQELRLLRILPTGKEKLLIKFEGNIQDSDRC